MGVKEDLGYYWTVTFQDNSTLEQFDGLGDEVAFGVAEQNASPIKKIKIISSEEDEDYEIDIGDGKIYTPTKTYTVLGTNPEYIYFRRADVRMKVGGTGDILTPRLVHHVGIKTDTEEKVVEVFKGLGQNPRKVTFKDKVNEIEEELT